MKMSRRAREVYERQAPKDRLGDAPVEEEYHAKMSAVAAAIDHFFNEDTSGTDRKIGFVLMVFPMNEASDGRVNYMSNGADRKDIVNLMKEMIARFEGQPEVSGHV